MKMPSRSDKTASAAGQTHHQQRASLSLHGLLSIFRAARGSHFLVLSQTERKPLRYGIRKDRKHFLQEAGKMDERDVRLETRGSNRRATIKDSPVAPDFLLRSLNRLLSVPLLPRFIQVRAKMGKGKH